jgi:hypothetical protein
MKPISSVNFGLVQANSDNPGGPTLRCTANLGAGNETCYILKQTGARRYTLASVAVPSRTLVGCYLVEGAPAAVGQMNVAVTPFGGSALSARKIMSVQVETFEDDGRYSWLLAVAASAAGQATVQHS